MNRPALSLARLAAFAFAALACGIALAQAYPTRPLTFVVPWGAGGGTDTTARYFAAMLEKELASTKISPCPLVATLRAEEGTE